MSKWSQDEIDTLIKLYTNNTNEYISVVLNRSEFSVFAKSRKLKLSKSKEHNAKIRKDRTRDISYAKTNKCYIHMKRNNLLYLLNRFEDIPKRIKNLLADH